MTYRNLSIVSVVILILFTGSIKEFAQRTGSTPIGLNRIEGRITDQSSNGVYNAFVELYDNYGSMVGSQRSSEEGRFSFRGMAPGRYVVAVKPFGSNLKEDSKEIEVNNQYSRSDTVVVEFRLLPDKRFENTVQPINGTVFAQDVPADAERLYKSGIAGIESKPDRAMTDLEEAVKLFPTYFNALAALGEAYVTRGKYDTGYPYLLRAIDVNAKCGDCYYSLAVAFYRLNQLTAAAKAIDAAVLLQPGTPTVYLLQGIIYRLNNDLPAAEKSLLTAKSLFKEPNPEVFWQLSLVYNRLKRNQEAADELELFLKSKPDMTKAEKDNVHDLIAKLRNSK